MNILTWNIQATKGCDGHFNAARIIKHIKSYGNLDVICLQEVSRHIPDLNADDQPSIIGNQFPDHEAIWAPGFSVSVAGARRCEFGNLTLVKRPLLKDSRVHCLPSPLVKELQIQRTMVEAIVRVRDFHIAVFNAHLAFHSSVERVQQIQALTILRNRIISKAGLAKSNDASGPYAYVGSSEAVILCGDLNVGSETDEFKAYITNQYWVDCWDMQQSTDVENLPVRQPTCGCFDRAQWPEGPHVRDYFLATDNIARRTNRVEVDVETDASDHQPVFLEIAL